MSRRKTKTCSLEGLLPCIGLQMVTTGERPKVYLNRIFQEATKDINRIVKKCPECGILFITPTLRSNQIFCCPNCSSKYNGRIRKEKNRKLAYHIIDKNAFSKWFKEYNNKVIGYIYNNYESELVEDLIDIWTDNAVIWYSKMWYKEKPFNFLELALGKYAKYIKCTKKEVFYDECSLRIQNKILGEINIE